MDEVSKVVADKGPWRTLHNGACVASDDFGRDVVLNISGDFASDSERMAYAEWLADRLTRAQQKAKPVAWSTIGPDGENSQFGHWHPMRLLEGFKKFAVLREGHSYVFAYAAPQPRIDSNGGGHD